MSAGASVPLRSRYEVTPYVADGGGGSLAGTLQLVSILSSVGILVGLAASFISQWFYLILIFPALMGVAVGLVGTKTIEHYHIRRPFLCGCAGFAAGCFCLLTMHYSDYWRFEGRLSEVPEEIRQIARDIDKLTAEGDRVPEEVRNVMTQLRAAPNSIRTFRVASFLGFMDLQAVEGVTISGHGGGNGMNLGYVGSIIYWLAEALVLACVATGMMTAAAAKPYCLDCNSWKRESPLIISSAPPDLILNSVRDGDLAAIEQSVVMPAPTRSKPGVSSKVTTHICPNCESAAPFEVSVVKVTTNSKGENVEANLGMTTYAGEALVPLLALVTRLTTPADPAPPVDA